MSRYKIALLAALQANLHLLAQIACSLRGYVHLSYIKTEAVMECNILESSDAVNDHHIVVS